MHLCVPTSFAARVKQLEAHIRSQVRLETPSEANGGKSRRSTVLPLLRSYERRKDTSNPLYLKLKAELDSAIPPPTGSEYLLSIFYELCAFRGYGAMGHPLPISLADIQAYSTMIAPLHDWEIRIIRLLDDAARDEHNLLNGGTNEVSKPTLHDGHQAARRRVA